MSPSRRERRAQRRWERDMLRRLEELDRVDRAHGLGAMPLGAPVGASTRHRRARGRRTTGPVLPGLLISGILAALVMLHDPGMTGYRFRQLVDHLSGKDDGAYAFLTTTANGDPVGWSPCEPIHYVVNPTGAPEGWRDIVAGATQRASDASGFRFRYDGTSDARDLDQSRVDLADPPPVLIVWADSAEVPALAGSTAGIGGSTPARIGGRIQYVTGRVVLDTEAYAVLGRDDASETMILTHELGHVLGLDHVDDVDELMNAEYVGQTGFGPGDRDGLARLHDLPC